MSAGRVVGTRIHHPHRAPHVRQDVHAHGHHDLRGFGQTSHGFVPRPGPGGLNGLGLPRDRKKKAAAAKVVAATAAAKTADATFPTPAAWTRPIGAVNAQTAAFKGLVDRTVRPDMFPNPGKTNGYQLLEMDINQWKQIQYPESAFACSPETKAKVNFRLDIYEACQKALVDLVAAAKAPPYDGSGWPGFATKANDANALQRRTLSRLYADWMVAVNSWVSLAFFCVNVQPAFLCADTCDATLPDGQMVPTRSPGVGLPAKLDTPLKEMVGTGVAQLRDECNAKQDWGPQWMGFYDKGEATGWLNCNFTPQISSRQAYLKTEDALICQNFKAGVSIVGETEHSLKVKSQDPWSYWYIQALHSTDGNELKFKWIRWDTKGKDAKYDLWMPGISVSRRMALAWADYIINNSVADHIQRSAGWYNLNYIGYWTKKLGGNIQITIIEADKLSQSTTQAKLAAKQQRIATTIESINASATAICACNPYAAIVAAAITVVSEIAMRIAFWRRKKKAAHKYDMMQPISLRTLSNADCSFFPPNVSLPESLSRFITEAKAEISTYVPKDTTVGNLPAVGTGDPAAPTPVAQPPMTSAQATAALAARFREALAAKAAQPVPVVVPATQTTPGSVTTPQGTFTTPPLSQVPVGESADGTPMVASEVTSTGPSTQSSQVTPTSDTIRTSVSEQLPSLTSMPTVATVTEAAAAEAQSNILAHDVAPAPVPMPPQIPWKWIAIGGVVVGGALLIRRP
jgi:hypothetical protein